MRETRTIAVIGAGAAGRRIAHATALGGYRTILEDIVPATLRRAQDEIRDNLEEAVGEGSVKREHAAAAMARIEFATSFEDAAREADMVIEAVPDEFESKEEIFRLLDRICRPATVLVATTCSLSITDIAAVTERPADIVGMRLQANSTQATSLQLEILRAARTSDETLSAALAVGRRMSSHASVVQEIAPFGAAHLP